MNLIKRVKNLWKLSECETLLPHQLQPVQSKHVRLIKKKMAKIVDLSPEVELD